MNVLNIPSITFFFPYYEVSGVPVLFLRMAQFISEKYGIETRIVDYPDGYMARTLREKKSSLVRIIHFYEGQPLYIPSDSVLVMQSILPYTMKTELKISKGTRVIFWTLYHLNLIQTIIPLPWFREFQSRHLGFHRLFMNTFMYPLKKRLQYLVGTMVNKKSLFFMDGSTLRYTSERLDIKVNTPVYVPVPCDFIPNNRKLLHTFVNEKIITFCWVGRIADFKTHILIYFIKKLSCYAVKRKISICLRIIGDGSDLKKIKNLNSENDFFNIEYLGIITGQFLDEYLLHNVDVLAAMGTSALEGAKLGVPTILLDASYGPITGDYKFKWLFESKEFGLADLLNDSHFEKNNNSLGKIIEEARSDYSAISNKTYEYCMRNHSISSVCEKFVNALQEASFCYGDFSPAILKKGFFRKSYEFARKAYSSL